MNVVGLSLCKQLYQVSNGAWDETEKVWCPFSVDGGETTQWQIETRVGQPYDWPAYDLGYLLRKLPRDLGSGTALGVKQLCLDAWVAYYHIENHPLDQEADTPEDAACKLAVELFKQGILTRD